MGMIPVLSFIRFKIYTAAPIHKQITRDVLRYMQHYFHLFIIEQFHYQYTHHSAINYQLYKWKIKYCLLSENSYVYKFTVRRRTLYVKSTSAHAWGHHKCPTFIGLTSFIPGLLLALPPAHQLIVTQYAISIYPSVHNQLIRTLFDARPVSYCIGICRLVLAFGASTCFTYDL